MEHRGSPGHIGRRVEAPGNVQTSVRAQAVSGRSSVAPVSRGSSVTTGVRLPANSADPPPQPAPCPSVAVVQLDDPLASPWSTARRICLNTVLAAWGVFCINRLTTNNDGVGQAALNGAMFAVLAALPVQVIGRVQFKRDSRPTGQGNGPAA